MEAEERSVRGQEAAAVALLRHGDIAGLEFLVRLHQIQAVRVAYSICRDPHMAEDGVADAFLVAYDRIMTFDPSRSFTPWFYRIVVNTTLQALRHQRRSVSGDVADRLLAGRPVAEAPSEVRLINEEMGDELMQEIDRLPAKQRAAFVLRYCVDMDEATVASTLGIPVGTVKWRLHAARRRLQGSLARRQDIRGQPQQEGSKL